MLLILHEKNTNPLLITCPYPFPRLPHIFSQVVCQNPQILLWGRERYCESKVPCPKQNTTLHLLRGKDAGQLLNNDLTPLLQSLHSCRGKRHFESKVQVRVPLCKFEFIPRKEFFPGLLYITNISYQAWCCPHL